MKASLLNMVAIISVSIATSLIYPLTAQATIAVVIDSPSGKLKGFTGVAVGSIIYNVTFIEGTVPAIFPGGLYDFTQQNDALNAANALLTAYDLFPQFDNTPANTFGCTSPFICNILTPYNTNSTSGVTNHSEFLNLPFGSFLSLPDSTGIVGTNAGFNSTSNTDFVFADWTPQNTSTVPEPTAMLLIGLGLLGLLGVSRRKVQV